MAGIPVTTTHGDVSPYLIAPKVGAHALTLNRPRTYGPARLGFASLLKVPHVQRR
jgi:hypothetical protein